jgi:hypothetical protein
MFVLKHYAIEIWGTISHVLKYKHLMEVSGQLHTLVAFIMGIALHLYVDSRLVGPLSHSGFGSEKDNFSKPLPEIQIC